MGGIAAQWYQRYYRQQDQNPTLPIAYYVTFANTACELLTDAHNLMLSERSPNQRRDMLDKIQEEIDRVRAKLQRCADVLGRENLAVDLNSVWALAHDHEACGDGKHFTFMNVDLRSRIEVPAGDEINSRQNFYDLCWG